MDTTTLRLCNTSVVHGDTDEHHAPYKLMFLFFVLFIGCLFKTLFASLRVPYAGLILSMGIVGGVLFNTFTKADAFLVTTISSPDLLMGIFLPALVFESAYRTEYHAFMKSLYTILLLSIIGYFISLISISVLNKGFFFFQQWTFLECILLGIVLSVTRPITLMRQADYGKTKRLSIILEGEAVINNALAIILFNSIKGLVVNDHKWHTFRFLKKTIIACLGGIGFGSIAGLLEIIGLPFFYDDPISEVTITTAIPYMLYWLCEQVNFSGVLAIVVLGIILSNHKTAISSEAAIFMEKFWDMLALTCNTIIYLLTALAISEFIKPTSHSSFNKNTIFLDIAFALINYFLCYLIRLMMISILSLCTKSFQSYNLSWKECLLATWGDFKGCICLILCLAITGEIQYTEKQNIENSLSKFKYQMLIYTTVIVFLSSCMNSTYSLLLKILDFTKISETKYLYMEQCVDSLRILVKEKIRLLKRNKYLATADWIFIEKNFPIENPHSASRQINAVEHRATYSRDHRSIPMEIDQAQNDDLVEEIRIRIINIQKTSFWRQYRDYEISTQAVRILSSLCDFAIDRRGQYITIDQLKFYYKPRSFDFIWKHLGSSVKKLYDYVYNDRRKYSIMPRNRRRLVLFNMLSHTRFNIFIIFIIILNVTLSIIRCSIILSKAAHLTLMIIQSLCAFVYLVEMIVKMYAISIRIYFRTWIHYRIEFILSIFILVECSFECCGFMYWRYVSREIWCIMQILVILQCIRLIRIVEYLTARLNVLLERIDNRYVTLSLELCKAYVLSEDDVLSKLHRIIETDEIRDNFRKDSIRRRDEIIDELTSIQTQHPSVSASVKTRAAVQKLLNYSKNIIHHMMNKGLLGENEALGITENINKRLHTELVPPTLFFPIPFNFLHIFPWLHDPDVLEFVLSRIQVKSFSLHEYVYKVNDDAQALVFITAGYVETIRNMPQYNDALSMERAHAQKDNSQAKIDSRSFSQRSSYVQKQSNDDSSAHLSPKDHRLSHQQRVENQKIDIIDRSALLNEDLFQWLDEDSEQKHLFFDNKKNLLNHNGSIVSQLNFNDSILNFFPNHGSTIIQRFVHAPGDIIGHIDLLNGHKHMETCKCITDTLIWYLRSDDLIILIERFNHLKLLEKIWHYTALKLAEIVLYEYLNITSYNATEQDRLQIYGYLKHAFLIPESYLIEHKIIYSSHELILIQGQLQNIASSLIYTGPCFIQIKFGQFGLRPLNINETKILVLRSSHHYHTFDDEFVVPQDLPGLLAHVIYDEKLCILLPRVTPKHDHIQTRSSMDETSTTMIKKTLLGRFFEILPKFQRRIMNA